MKALLCLIVVAISIIAGFAIQYLSLRFGWGLEVKSWPVVLGTWVVSVINLAILSIARAAMESKE